MIVHLAIDGDWIMVQARAVSADGETIGDMMQVVTPGSEFMGHTHSELLALGDGEHNLTEKETA
jgi:hypothetical protein